MEAIVLAGGFGTRLKKVVQDVPKPMAPVADKPFLSYLLDQLDRQGCAHAVLAVGYKREAIQDFFGSGYKGISLSYSIEDKPLLTGGALKKALQMVTEESVLVLNGDTFFGVNFSKMMDFHYQTHSDATLAVKELHDFSRYGTVHFDDDYRITRFVEKKACQEGFINGGVYVLNRTLFGDISQDKFMMEKDFLEKYVDSKVFSAFPCDGYFIDIGIPEDYEKANKEFTNLV